MIARLFRKIGGFVGIAMLAIGIAALIILVCQFHSCGWTDPRIISLGIAAVVLIGTFFARMSRWFRRRERLFLYFIFLIAIVGNLGTLVTLGQFVLGGTATYLAVLKSFATYTIAVAAISFADRLMQPPEDHADNRTLLLRWLGVAIISIGAGVIVLYSDTIAVINYTMAVSAVCAVLLWFAANIDHPNLVKATDAYSTVGGGNPMSDF